MKTLTKYLIIFITFYMLNINLFANEKKNILILNSYHKGFAKSDEIVLNLEKFFINYPYINSEILYMDSKQISSRDYIAELSSLYKIQLHNRKYDLIITIDPFSYLFALKNHSIIFKGEPILFGGVETFSKELINIYGLDTKVNGLVQKLPINENINLIEQMIPNLKKLYIINDRSINGDYSSSLIRKAIAKIKNKYEVEYIRDGNLEDFIDYFKTYKENEAILFVRYSTNPSGDFYKDKEVMAAIQKFQIPVFVLDDLFLNKGVVGGNIISSQSTGRSLGEFALNIINKKLPVPSFEDNDIYQYTFDYHFLNKYNLRIPITLKNTKIFNKPLDFFERNQELIKNVFMATPFLMLIIFVLIQIIYEKQQNAKKLQQRIKFDKVLLNSIEHPIFWQNNDGIILDANQNFCEIVNLKYHQLLDNSLNKFYNSDKNVRKLIDFIETYEKNQTDSQISIKLDDKIEKIYLLNKKKYLDPNTNSLSSVTILTDITKEKEEALEKSKQTQYFIQQTKLAEIGEIFSSIAHQWKSPLVEITALAQDLFYSQERSEKEEDSYHINNIMTQVQYMTKTINDFQDFIIPSSQKTSFDLETTLDDLFNIVNHNMKYNYINIDINTHKYSNFTIYGYQNEFMQALLNIINNAKDALLNNAIGDRNITIDIDKKLSYIIIDISDNGDGIDKKSIDKIFLQYFSTKEKGHGIGLYMTKLIIEDKLNGKISYKQKEKGSCFRIIIKEYHENSRS